MSSHNDSFAASGSSPTGETPPSASAPTCDLIFENHLSLFLIRPVSQAGKTWLDENVGDENTLTFGGAVVCEPRYIENIFLGATADGLVCR
ncbi:MAG: hypothetical protein DMG78_23200 [Acidobacteria bacterium]|nr:MAG: hypothetical protein DMG78_23200 [Acidobacteriota bacterium]